MDDVKDVIWVFNKYSGYALSAASSRPLKLNVYRNVL